MQLAQVDWKQRVHLVILKKNCTQYLTKLQTQLHCKPYEIIVDYKWRQTIHQIYRFVSCYKKFWTEQTLFALQTFDFYLQYEKKYYLKLLITSIKNWVYEYKNYKCTQKSSFKINGNTLAN